MTALGGMEDREVDLQQLELWGMETAGMFSLHKIPGDHFFLPSEEAAVLTLISEILNALIDRYS